MTYRNCKKLIQNKRYQYDDMLNKLDIFLLNDRIKQSEYEELKGIMDAAQSPTN